MNHHLIAELTEYVHNAEKDKKEIEKITAQLYPTLTIEEAYMIQEELIKQKLEQGYKIVGPKMGITSEAKMKQMNVKDPVMVTSLII